MQQAEMSNVDFIGCWNEILVPKWKRFRHLLSGNGKIHSDIALEDFAFAPGEKVLDIGCGFGETCLEIGQIVGPSGEVLGLDCTKEFLDIAESERRAAGVSNVRYALGDAQTHALPEAHFDVVYSRFGVMFFGSVVMALRNAHRASTPDARLCMIVWRSLADNPCWRVAKEVALRHLPPPGDDARTCGPGPFSMADEETTRAMMKAAGFGRTDLFRRVDAEICVGISVGEAIDYQILVGPSGEIIREAGDEGQAKLPLIREELEAVLSVHARADGEVWMPSSTWVIVGRKDR